MLLILLAIIITLFYTQAISNVDMQVIARTPNLTEVPQGTPNSTTYTLKEITERTREVMKIK